MGRILRNMRKMIAQNARWARSQLKAGEEEACNLTPYAPLQ